MLENSYWSGNGLYEEENSKIEKHIPTFGMTSNPYLNLYIVACNIYYDAYNNGGYNMTDYRIDKYRKYILPFNDEIKGNGAINFGVKNNTLRQYFRNENKLEKFMDNVIMFVSDKDLSCDKFTIYIKDDYMSLNNHEGFHPVTFGNIEDKDEWVYGRIHGCKCEWYD